MRDEAKLKFKLEHREDRIRLVPSSFLCSAHIWSRDEVMSNACPVPKVPGVYSWFFKNMPSSVPTSGCIMRDGKVLLYIGISPSAPPSNGKGPSRQSLWHRVRYHYRGNAEGSTLRLTLGCLLASDLGIELRRVGSGKRLTFGNIGEAKLSEWMGANAFVTFQICDKPWEVEEKLIASTCLPLNLDLNRHSSFHAELTALRRAAKQRARELSVLAQ